MDIYIPFMDIYIPFMDIYIYPIYGYSYYTSFITVGKKTHPICSRVLECLPTFARTKSPSFVGKYPSTMEHTAYEHVESLLFKGP